MKNSELISKLQQFPGDLEVKQVFNLQFGVFISTDFLVKESPQAVQDMLEEPEDPFLMLFTEEETEERKCRVCGCTDGDCTQCFKKTGQPCYWVEEDLCSACMPAEQKSSLLFTWKRFLMNTHAIFGRNRQTRMSEQLSMASTEEACRESLWTYRKNFDETHFGIGYRNILAVKYQHMQNRLRKNKHKS